MKSMSTLLKNVAGWLAAAAGAVLIGTAAQAAPAASAGMGSPFAGAAQPKTVTVELVARRTAGIPRAANDIGILLKHEPGWHTYWQFSGDSGYPPSVEWKLPRNWKAESRG